MPNIRINFDASYFEKHLSDVTCGLNSVNSADFEEHFVSHDPEELNFDIDLEPVVFSSTPERTSEDNLIASLSLEELIKTHSNESNASLDDALTSAIECSTASHYLSWRTP